MKVRRAVHTAIAGGLGTAAAIGALAAPFASGKPANATASAVAAPGTPIYLDRSYSYEERAADLVSRMTTAEKASQLISSRAPAIPRLGIRTYGQWNEALHGVSRSSLADNANATTLDNTTSYPTDQTLGSSWDPDLVHRVASAIGDEAREVSPDNTLNLEFYSPTMNLERDPRWGRNDETYGEDPFLVTKLVSQFVDGMEGKDADGKLPASAQGYYKTLTTIKHYAANNSESNRRTGSSNMDDRTLREYYTKAFRGIVQAAQPGSVMSSYNSVNAQSPAPAGGTSSAGDPHNPNGAPTSADPYLIDTLLRQTFGFEGYVTSDCDAVFEEVRSHRWTIPNWPSPAFARPVNNTERNALAQSAGEDSNCNTGYRDNFGFLNRLPEATGQDIPTLVDHYSVNDLDVAATRVFTARMKLGEFDDPSLVPWVQQARNAVPQGTWTNDNANGAKTQTASRLALAREAGDKSIVLLKNSGATLPLRVPATGTPRIAVMGVLACPSATVSGQATTCPNAGNVFLGGYSANELAAGQANIVTGYDGIKKAVQTINPNAVVDLWRGFTGTGAKANTLTTVDPAAVAAASSYDAVVVYVGTDDTTAAEDTDRATMTLPGVQESLVNQVAAANPHTVAYMETIGPMDVSAFVNRVPALLWSSYNGQRKGEALADVLLGAYNPSGRLPSIWHHDISQIPAVTDYDIRPKAGNPGRTYMYYDPSVGGALQYPFGYGLSYSTFAYANLRLDRGSVDANAQLRVSVDVTNTSAVAGTDVAQLYVSTPNSPAALQRPIKRLEGFEKVALAPGQTKTVTFDVKVADLAFFDQDAGHWVVDTGRYGIQIGRSSADVVAQDTVDVSGTLTPTVNVVDVKPAMAGDAERDITDRVLFPQGATVRPNVTVSMSDDTLYGFVRNERGTSLSHPLPDGMRISYRSNRPNVVGDDLKTGDAGVATITATASYHGVERSRSFVVRVVAQLTGIALNGQPLAGFRADTPDYDVVLPDGTAAPQVSTTAGAGTDVKVDQAARVPGTARITVTGADGTVRDYALHFAPAARDDEFTGAVAGGQWTWIRRTQFGGMSASTPDELGITTEAGDITSTPTSGLNNARNLLVQPALGDWTIESKVDFSALPSAATQQAGILAYEDDDNYLRVGLQYAGGGPQIAETIEDSRSCCYPGYAQGSGPSSQVLTTATPSGLGKSVWLRMSKAGARYRTWYSTDGQTWTALYETGASLRDAKVGVFAFNGTGTTNLPVAFDYFRITGQTPATPVPGTPAATSPTAGPAPRPDRTQPRIRLRSAGRQSLKRLRTSGLAFSLSVDEPVTLKAGLLGRFTAAGGQGRGRRVTVARSTAVTVRPGQSVTLRFKPSATLRKRLRRERRLPAELQVRATDRAGNVSTRSKALSFR